MSYLDDRTFLQGRAVDERAFARDSGDDGIAILHTHFAELYDEAARNTDIYGLFKPFGVNGDEGSFRRTRLSGRALPGPGSTASRAAVPLLLTGAGPLARG